MCVCDGPPVVARHQESSKDKRFRTTDRHRSAIYESGAMTPPPERSRTCFEDLRVPEVGCLVVKKASRVQIVSVSSTVVAVGYTLFQLLDFLFAASARIREVVVCVRAMFLYQSVYQRLVP